MHATHERCDVERSRNVTSRQGCGDVAAIVLYAEVDKSGWGNVAVGLWRCCRDNL